MKYLFFFFIPIFVQAQVKWESGLSEAFQKAREQDKVVFVEFYSPGCPYCQRIAPFFMEKAVADLYNGAFINYQLNVETEEGREFVEKAGLDMYGIPYFLFFRADSTLVHAREVSAVLSSVLQPGKMVVEKTYTGENYAQRFAKGERSENFLTHYALFSRVKKDTLANKRIINALWEIYPEEKRLSHTSWIILKKAMMDAQNGFADGWLSHAAEAEAWEGNRAGVESAFLRVFYGTLFSREARGFGAGEWKTLREKFTPVLGEKAVLGLTWEHEVRGLLKTDNTAGALELAERAAMHFQNDASGLRYLAQVVEENCKACEQAVARWREAASVNTTKENRN